MRSWTNKPLQILTIVALGGPLLTNAQVSTDCASIIAGQECGDRLNTITTAVPFLMISPDSRAGGMGDAGVATSPDANSIHWNPAKLAFVENESAFSISFSPWLRNIVPDMSLAYLSGYKRSANKRSAVGGSLRYFNLGNITFTDQNGQTIREFQPTEFAIDVAYGQQFSDKFSGGIALRYINSNLTGGISVQGADSKPGQSIAGDVSFFYQNKDIVLGGRDATFAFGGNFSNIGAKIAYTETTEQDFIPINMRIGPALTYEFDKFNKITIALDANKLLVPTPPVFQLDENDQPVIDPNTGDFVIANGVDPDVGIASGIFGSFSDAPGAVTFDDNGNAIIESGSVFREELREINIGSGFEYWYADQFAFRAGYFWEHFTKGNRKYVTIGAGLKYNILGIDFSYLIANTQRSPLANTLRFTIAFDFNKNQGNKEKPSGS